MEVVERYMAIEQLHYQYENVPVQYFPPTSIFLFKGEL